MKMALGQLKHAIQVVIDVDLMLDLSVNARFKPETSD